MSRHQRRRLLQYLLDTPSIVVFIIVMSVYTFTGSSDAASPTADSIPLILSEEGTENASETFDPLTPISDESLEAASDSDVLVLLDDNTVSSVPLETYVSRVVASEMPSDFSFEALKAQAVAARTYVEGRRMQYESGTSKHPEAFVCATTCCQVYRDESGLRSVKSDEWYENDFNKIKNAVAQTAGEMLYYNGELVQQPLFFSSAGGGRTENSEDVFAGAFPYLRSVDSEYDSPEKYTDNVTTFPLNEALKKVTEYASSNPSAVTVISDNADASQIEVMSRTEGGGAKLVRFGSTALTGRQTRTVFNLPSSDMTVSSDGETVTFTTQGSGHRVGLSQYGADGMAQHGYSYSEILSHYYSGTTVH